MSDLETTCPPSENKNDNEKNLMQDPGEVTVQNLQLKSTKSNEGNTVFVSKDLIDLINNGVAFVKDFLRN